MTVVRVVLALFFLLTASVAGAEPLSPEKRADIEKLLQMTGATTMGKQMGLAVVAQMSLTIKQVRPEIPQRVLDVLPDEVGGVFDANLGSFIATIVPLYHRYFTGAEIKEMIRFYSTPLGKKTIQVMPALLNESMEAGQKWGQSLGPAIDQRVKARLKKEGYSL